jgi:hypothetical protein
MEKNNLPESTHPQNSMTLQLVMTAGLASLFPGKCPLSARHIREKGGAELLKILLIRLPYQ